jgi:TRAP-type C4-dicarboxylate transport system permease small subunit
MNILKYTAFLFLGFSFAGFLWVAWLLIVTPTSSFDTQGPGLVGAFVMFAAQILGFVGIFLFAVWIAISSYRGSRRNSDKIQPAKKSK